MREYPDCSFALESALGHRHCSSLNRENGSLNFQRQSQGASELSTRDDQCIQSRAWCEGKLGLDKADVDFRISNCRCVGLPIAFRWKFAADYTDNFGEANVHTCCD